MILQPIDAMKFGVQATLYCLLSTAFAFQGHDRSCRVPWVGKPEIRSILHENRGGSGVEEYRNSVTKALSNFMSSDSMAGKKEDPIAAIDFQAPKIPSSTSLETLAAALDYELIETEWFVTGKVNPIYFSEDFEFQDPDVQLKGIDEYARGVYRLFDQATSRAEIISTVVNTTASTSERPVITCTWRLSGKVNIGFGIPIKPYIVYTDFVVDPSTSLIVFQEDRFDLPSWDILLR